MDREISYTTDHWTGPSDQTFSTHTAHYIDESWSWNLESCVIDFKVFKGSISGEAIYQDTAQILAKCKTSNESVMDVFGVTDSTGSMGVLGRYCRETVGGMHIAATTTFIAMLFLHLNVSLYHIKFFLMAFANITISPCF